MTFYVCYYMKVDEGEAKKLGLKDEEFEIGKFISANSQEKTIITEINIYSNILRSFLLLLYKAL